MRRVWAIGIGVVLVAGAVASSGELDARGWHSGQVAAGLGRTMGPATEEPVTIGLPKVVAKLIHRQTLLVYLSPTCPHCQRVAPELAKLGKDLEAWADVVAFVPEGFDAAAIEAFRVEHGFGFPVLQDVDHAIARAVEATGTPSALLVEPTAKKQYTVLDAWYPYTPGSNVPVLMRASKNPFGPFTKDTYVGNDACGSCHTEEMQSWYLTHHSIAWGTLRVSDKDTDPACTSCHVTGAGQPTGWVAEGTSPLVDVGCEACHGPGGPHDGNVTDAKTQCAGCHDKDHSIAFSYEKGLAPLDHFKASSMTEIDFRAAREDLVDGKVARDLLAFPSGRTLGAEACASCHPAETADWKASKHREAMTQLPPHHAEAKVECVACHATALTSGPGTRDLADYRTSEGVGCESCHGPGEAHVAAGGGKENIVGLGASCPVCVIEAVCTSCHTSGWDPLWDLDKKLPMANHGHAVAPH